MKLNVLGTDYTINIVKKEDNISMSTIPELEGYCDFTTKEIFVCNFLKPEVSKDSVNMKDLAIIMKHVLRHELIHAYFYESGFDTGIGNFEKGEDMIDWFSLQEPKMRELFIKGEKFIDTLSKNTNKEED